MRHNHRLHAAAACGTAFLLVAWIGGAIGAAGFKAAYWLLFGVWPQSAIQGLLPDAAIRAVLALPADDLAGLVLPGLIQLDLLTLILVGPPLALLPCLAILLAGREPGPIFPRKRLPFATGPVHDRGTDSPEQAACSTESGPLGPGALSRRWWGLSGARRN